ncbi:MAG: flagellar biosynthetic protein FliQ [Pseudomonadota bacterium]
MQDGVILDTLREALWVSVLVSTPLLSVALIGGLIIGLFQALTSIQELTLTFVPKIVAMGVVFWVSIDFMSRSIVDFFHSRVIAMVAGG